MLSINLFIIFNVIKYIDQIYYNFIKLFTNYYFFINNYKIIILFIKENVRSIA